MWGGVSIFIPGMRPKRLPGLGTGASRPSAAPQVIPSIWQPSDVCVTLGKGLS